MYAELTKVKELFTKFWHIKWLQVCVPSKRKYRYFTKKLNENNLTQEDLYLKVWIDMQFPSNTPEVMQQ